MTEPSSMGDGPLKGYQVIEIAGGEGGSFAGRLLADLGADVIKIEPPEGSPMRRGLDDGSTESNGPRWLALNAGKRSLILEAGKAADRPVLEALLHRADIVVLDEKSVFADGEDFHAASLMAAYPSLVVLVITPFGLEGPHARWASSDLVQWAMSGVMISYGDPDRAPLTFGIQHASMLGAVHAVAGALAALHARDRNGCGDLVDLSVQDSLLRCHMPAPLMWAYDQAAMARAGNRAALNASASIRILWPCRDGQVNFAMWGGRLGRFTKNCVEWMHAEGLAEGLINVDWDLWDPYNAQAEQLVDFENTFERFFKHHTVQELVDGGISWRFPISPVNSIADVYADQHLLSRDYWQTVDQDGVTKPIRFPGSPYRFSASKAGVKGPAPALDADRSAILSDIQTARADTDKRELPFCGIDNTSSALQDIKILDLSLMFAGPWSTTYLADFGAQVVRVESRRHTDPAREHPPFRDGVPGLDRSYMGMITGNGKASITIDLTSAAGLELLYDLVRWADVVTESYSTGAAERMGLGYEKLRSINDKIVMLSTNLEGRTGPRANSVGFGTDIQGRSGLVDSTGWPDRGSSVPHNAYGDVIAPWFGAIAILAALAQRRRTGEGQYIELSMYETLLSLAVVPLINYDLNGLMPRRAGNRSPDAAPHGVYPCTGEDRWCAIAVKSDQDWTRLCFALGNPEWCRDKALTSLTGRKAAEDSIDAQLSAWTSSRTPQEVASILQNVGVAAGPVQSMEEVLERDPHIARRGIFTYHSKRGLGPVMHYAAPPQLRRRPRATRSSPLPGEQTEWVCKTILGMGDNSYQELLDSGVLV